MLQKQLPDRPPPSNWRLDEIRSMLCDVMSLHGYPSLNFASFVIGVHRYILLHMWFYNMLLKWNVYSYKQWIKRKKKPILCSVDQDTFQDSFDKDNPEVRFKQSVSVITQYSKLTALAMLTTFVTQVDSIQLQSETSLRKQLEKFCHKMNGSLDINRIPDGEIK
jgi:hypothetical protein